MNLVALTGRTTKEPEIRHTNSEKSVAIASFTLAVDRKIKKDGQPTADFITCKAFGKTAEVIEKYVTKGSKINVTGAIQTGSYDKDGKKVYTTDVIVDSIDFCESKGASNSESKSSGEGYMNVPSGLSDELPFM